MIARVSGLAVACALAAAPLPARAADETPRRPNVLLIIADDVGVDLATGMYPGLIDQLTEQYGPDGLNHPDYKKIDQRPASTPVLDGFARQGMVFSQAWAQPFCSPTRASLLTGLFASHTGVATYADPLSQNHHSFVADLRDKGGYATAVFGKWHMAGLPGQGGAPDYPGMKPKQAGFDLYRGDMHAALPTYFDYPVQVQDGGTAPGEWRTEDARMRSLPGIAPTRFAPVAKAADTIEWIEAQEHENPDKPWFVWLAFNLAHATIRSDPSQMAIPDKDTLDAATIAEIDACGGHYGTQDTGNCSGEAQMRAMTNAMDTVIGKILAAVEAIDPDTYVIFIGDNGTPMYGRPNLDFIDNLYITRKGRGKSTAFESGARVPLAIRGPGIEGGTRSDAVVDVVDLFPTILQFAGLPVPATVPDSAGTASLPLDGTSLKPLLDRTADSVRQAVGDVILTESTNLMTDARPSVVGARDRRYKVVCTDSADDCLFYDLSVDPLEEYPLAKPSSCDAAPAEDAPEWHYCELTRVVAERSIVRTKGS